MMQTSRLVPYIRNARTHSDEQVAQIAASIAEFSFINPILIGEDDVIIAGHGRLLAAQSLGLTEVPVIVLDHLSEAQRRALILADNRIAENAGWDNAMLASELAALRDENFDLDMIGFDEAESEELLAGFEFGDAGALGGEGYGGGTADSDQSPAASTSGSLTQSVRRRRSGRWNSVRLMGPMAPATRHSKNDRTDRSNAFRDIDGP